MVIGCASVASQLVARSGPLNCRETSGRTSVLSNEAALLKELRATNQTDCHETRRRQFHSTMLLFKRPVWSDLRARKNKLTGHARPRFSVPSPVAQATRANEPPARTRCASAKRSAESSETTIRRASNAAKKAAGGDPHEPTRNRASDAAGTKYLAWKRCVACLAC